DGGSATRRERERNGDGDGEQADLSFVHGAPGSELSLRPPGCRVRARTAQIDHVEPMAHQRPVRQIHVLVILRLWEFDSPRGQAAFCSSWLDRGSFGAVRGDVTSSGMSARQTFRDVYGLTPWRSRPHRTSVTGARPGGCP